MELPDAAVAVLNEIVGEWRAERRNLKIGVATVAAEFVLERLRRDPRWKKRLAESGKTAGRGGSARNR